ncbi:MAG: retropepsin-like aspartic protease [Candidatus Limnocylindria bacterium]
MTITLLLPGETAAELYRWQGPDGTTYYTGDLESIPPAHRASARAIGHPGPRSSTPPAPPAARATTVIPFSTGAPVVVDAFLNGVPLRLMLDTGADRTVLSHDVVERAGYSLAGGTPVSIHGVTGTAAATLLNVPRLDVAGARVGPLAIVVHSIRGVSVDGLLGRDVLDAFTITVDGAANRATLVPR